MLGLLFPSITGIMTGYNLSGDLAHAGSSLQTGTKYQYYCILSENNIFTGNTWSAALTFVIYIGLSTWQFPSNHICILFKIRLKISTCFCRFCYAYRACKQRVYISGSSFTLYPSDCI